MKSEVVRFLWIVLIIAAAFWVAGHVGLVGLLILLLLFVAF